MRFTAKITKSISSCTKKIKEFLHLSNKALNNNNYQNTIFSECNNEIDQIIKYLSDRNSLEEFVGGLQNKKYTDSFTIEDDAYENFASYFENNYGEFSVKKLQEVCNVLGTPSHNIAINNTSESKTTDSNNFPWWEDFVNSGKNVAVDNHCAHNNYCNETELFLGEEILGELLAQAQETTV